MTRKGDAARRRLIDAAWELSDASGPETVLAGASLRRVAARAGMSPAGLTYQYPTMRGLAVGMVERLVESVSALPPEVIGAVQDMAVEEGLAAAIRAAATANWQKVTGPDELAFQRRLLRSTSALDDGATSAELGDVRAAVAAIHRRRTDHLSVIYRATAGRLGLQMVEPFTFDDLAVVSNVIVDGFVHRWMFDDDPAAGQRLADVLVTFVTAMLTPSDRAKLIDEVTTSLPRPGRGAGADTPHPGTGGVEAAEVLGRLFADGTESVTLTEVSRALGCSVDDVVERYGQIRSVAALSFVRHVPDVVEAIGRRRHLGPEVSVADGLYELAKCVRADRHCALALLHERIDARLGSPGDPSGPVARVPLDAAFRVALAESGGSTDAAVAVAVDMVLGAPSTHPHTPPADGAALAARLLSVS